MQDGSEHGPIDYGGPATPTPMPMPRSFKHSSVRSGDDAPVTIIKWIVAVLLLVWIVAAIVIELR